MNTSRQKQDGSKADKSQERKLLWDEENRLLALDDNGFVSRYWYDAGGERVIKESGDGEGIYVNNLFSGGRTETGNFTAYINPYLVVSPGGSYTKHIYIGNQRIVSKLGDLDSYGADPRRIPYAGADVEGSSVDYKGKYTASIQNIKDAYKAFDVPYYGKDNDDYVNGQGFCCNNTKSALKAGAIGTGNDNPELYQYYYHSDHLGSSSLITNLDGETVQHIEYVPFGEVFIEERNNVWNTPYKFNAKELDEETGLYYYGARYYDPRISLWYGVDPLAEKYPNMSGYAYSALNPVKFVDTDGKDIIVLLRSQSVNILGYHAGHLGVLIGSDEKGWVYISKEGEAHPTDFSFIQGSPSTSYYAPVPSLEVFYRSPLSKDYDKSVRFKTSETQDNLAKKASAESAQSWYQFLDGNCADAVSEGLAKAGLDPGYSTFSSIDDGIWSTDIKSSTLDPRPAVRFEAIIENNKKYIYSQTTPSNNTSTTSTSSKVNQNEKTKQESKQEGKQTSIWGNNKNWYKNK